MSARERGAARGGGAVNIVLHDYFELPEGGGRLCLAVVRGFGADLGYGFRAPEHPFFAEPLPGRELAVSRNLRLPVLKQRGLAHDFTRNAGFLRYYDHIFYSGTYAPLAVDQAGRARNVFYCHTPPRFLYDQHEHYLDSLNRAGQALFRRFTDWLRPRYERAVGEMDVLLTNSGHVRRRMELYLGQSAQVIHPPCDLKRFRLLGEGDFFLSAGRLDSLKRVGLIVEAFAGLPERRLVVISDGPEASALRRRCRELPNVEFLGPVSEERYRELLGSCAATIYVPVEEDFGMTAVESLACGKPVLGSDEGGLREIVRPGENGLLLPEVTAESLREAVAAFRSDDYSAEAIRRTAEPFSQERFLAEIAPHFGGRG